MVRMANMSDFDYSNYERRDMSAEEISKVINKRVLVFGVKMDELSWAFTRSLPYIVIVALGSLIVALFGQILELSYLTEIAVPILFLSIPVTIVSTYLHVKVIGRLNKRFGEGSALLALATTGFFTILFSPKKVKKNYDFKVAPNNNYQRMQ